MSNSFAFIIYFILYAACTYGCAYLPYHYFELSLWICIPVALAVSWLPTLVLAFIIWPPLGMLLGIVGNKDQDDEAPQHADEKQHYVIDTKTGERVDPSTKDQEQE